MNELDRAVDFQISDGEIDYWGAVKKIGTSGHDVEIYRNYADYYSRDDQTPFDEAELEKEQQ